MIFSLKGIVQELGPTYTVIETGGVGYYLGISLQTSQKLVAGREARLYTQQIFREDAQLLFGFHDKAEKEMFSLLISVSGVGPASALIMLSSLSNAEIAAAIVNGQSGILQKVKGIGVKTAERIVVDLRDKMNHFRQDSHSDAGTAYNKVKSEALEALEVLGIPKRTSEKIADRALKQEPDLSVEQLIKYILKHI